MRTDSPQVADDDLRLINCEELAPQELNQGLLEKLSSLSYVIFFKNIVARALDVLKVDCEFVQVSAVQLYLRLHRWEQEKRHHCEMLLCEKSFRQKDCHHKIPHSLSHAARPPVLPALEQIQLSHVLTQIVSELPQQRFVKSILLDFLDVMAVDLLCFLALVAHRLLVLIKSGAPVLFGLNQR